MTVSSSRYSDMFIRLRQESRTEEVIRRMMEAIDLGIFCEGQQLPSESELSSQFGVSTVTLREAFSDLRRRGVIKTRRGRNGGSFICETSVLSDATLLEQLNAFSNIELRDLCDELIAVSGTSARLAAKRFSSEHKRNLDEFVQALGQSKTRKQRRQADARFHIEIAAASQSLRLTQAEIRLQAELGELNWLYRDDTASIIGVQKEHESILDAISSGEDNLAGALMEAHVNKEMKRLIDIKLKQLAREPAELAKASPD